MEAVVTDERVPLRGRFPAQQYEHKREGSLHNWQSRTSLEQEAEAPPPAIINRFWVVSALILLTHTVASYLNF